MKKLLVSALFLLCFGAQAAEPIVTDSTSRSTITQSGETTSTIKSPPPTAIAPSFTTSNSDLCTIGVAGAVQTQILGISAGTVYTEENCIRLKNAKILYDMGMKVAAISVMCQDVNVFDAMMNAGTPCPKDGLIGDEAKAAWAAAEENSVESESGMSYESKKWIGVGSLGALLLLLL